MEKRELLCEGKAKKLWRTDDPNLLVQYFKDDATAFNNKKKGTIEDKGVINNRMSEIFFSLLAGNGVPNHFVSKFLDGRGILLVDMKFEFGRHQGEVILGDEICPDTCRFWDKKTREKLDKDRFRRDLGGVEDAYREMIKRVSG